MEKENLTNFGLIDNSDTNTPISASCDCVIDKNGNTIYKCYNNIYKLTYRHIYKYRRISSVATEVIYDKYFNAYVPLYHFCYFDIYEDDEKFLNDKVKGENEGEDKKECGIIDELTYGFRCPQKKYIRYDIKEMLLLRFLTLHEDKDIEGELSKNCFLRERRVFSKTGSGVRFHKDRSANMPNVIPRMNGVNLMNMLGNNSGVPIAAGPPVHVMKMRNGFTEIPIQRGVVNPRGYNPNFGLNPLSSVNPANIPQKHINQKMFKNWDDNLYNGPTNNVYIDKDGKIHLTGAEFFNLNANQDHMNMNMNMHANYGKTMYNKFNPGYMKKDMDGDYEYNMDKMNARNNSSEKYWDNPTQYPKGSPIDIFSLGDIKKLSMQNDKMMRNNNVHLGNTNNSIFKDSEEENLTKSNFAKWFKNNHINVNDSTDGVQRIEQNKEARTNEGCGSKFEECQNTVKMDSNNQGKEELNNYENDPRVGTQTNNDSLKEEKISNTIAELLVKQISMWKERNGPENFEKRSFMDYLNGPVENEEVNTNNNEAYGKEAGKKILEMFKNFNSNNIEMQQPFQQVKPKVKQPNLQLYQLQQLQQLQQQLNNNMVNKNQYNYNKFQNMDHFAYKTNYMDNNNYVNDSALMENVMMNKRYMKNNYNMPDGLNTNSNNKNGTNSFNSFNNYYGKGLVGTNNMDGSFVGGGDGQRANYNNTDFYKNKNGSQRNINITPIINSILRLDNENEYAYNGGPSIGVGPNQHSITENIQNAKVNNVLDSLKSLLKASKQHTGNGSGNNINNNKMYTPMKNYSPNNGNFMNISAQPHYPLQHMQQQQQRIIYKDMNKKNPYKKDSCNMKYQPTAAATTVDSGENSMPIQKNMK